MVILDSQWLTQVFSTIVSMKNQYAKDGKMKPSALVHMWKPPKYPESLHPMLLKILEKFEISYKLEYVHHAMHKPVLIHRLQLRWHAAYSLDAS
jgi:hypothetical protein